MSLHLDSAHVRARVQEAPMSETVLRSRCGAAAV